jgi:large subunit ribosomal protein L10
VDRKTKQELATSLNQVFRKAGCVVVARNGGLTVAEMSDLRRQVRAAGARFRITKNRITKLALDGTSYVPIRDLLKGPTGIAYSDDPVAAAKVVVGFASKNDKLAIVGGAMGGSALDAEGVKALAALPSLDQLRGKLVGLLQAPASKIAAVLAAPGAQVARVLKAYADKDGGTEAAA